MVAVGAGDAAPRAQAAAADRRRHHVPAAHRGADRPGVRRHRPCTCSTRPGSSAWCRDLLDPERAETLDAAQPGRAGAAARAARQPARRSRCSPSRRPGPTASRSTSTTCRRRRSPASARSSPTLAELREMIDWQFLFLAWELKGKYPAILEQPVARELFDDAQHAARRDHRGRLAPGPRRVRLLAGALRGRRHRRWPTTACGSRCCASRPTKPAGPPQPLPRRLHRPGRRPPRRLRRRHPRRRASWPRGTRPSTTTTARSWSRRWPTGSPRRSPSTSTCEARRDVVRAGRRAGAGGPARRAVPRHPARARLPGQPRPQPEAGAVRPARRGRARHRPDRVVRDDPGRQRQRADLRAPGRRATSPSAGSAGTRSRTTRARRGLPVAEVERWLRPNLA